MRAHELTSTLPEAAMRPREYSAALGADAGIKVGYEFEVCMPLKYAVGGQTVAKPTTRTIQAAISRSNALSELVNSPQDLERFDGVFHATRGTTRYDTAVGAHADLVRSAERRVVELWDKLPEDYRVLIKEYIDRVGVTDAARDGVYSQQLPWLNEQTLYAAAVLGAAQKLKRTVRGTAREYDRAQYIWASLASILRGISTPHRILLHQTGLSFAVELEDRFNRYYRYEPDAAREFLGDHYLQGLIGSSDDDEETALYRRAARRAARQVESAFNMPVTVFTNYHERKKSSERWYIEPDSSIEPRLDDVGAEIVTPPYPLARAVDVLQRFYALARNGDWYTSADCNTGLHINISIPGEVDLLKLALFSGDEAVLRKWGREFSEYAESMMGALRDGERPPVSGFVHRVEMLRDIAAGHGSKHYSSISSENARYISFRHVGGNYLAEYDEVWSVLGRFVRALQIAADPNAYREEYLKRLYTLTTARDVSGVPDRGTELRQLITGIRRDGLPALRVWAAAYGSGRGRALERSAPSELTGIANATGTTPYLTPAPRDAVASALLSHARTDGREVMNKVIDRASDAQLLSGVWTPPTSMLGQFTRDTRNRLTRLIIGRDGKWLGYAWGERTTLPPDSPQAQQVLVALMDAARKYLSRVRSKTVRESEDRRFLWWDQEPEPQSRQRQPRKQLYYMAYGMLTDPHHMRMYRDAELIGRVRLPHYRLELLQHANIAETPGSSMWGTLWRIDTEILQSLDITEGYPHYYTRIERDVTADDGAVYRAQIYVMTPQSRSNSLWGTPDLRYLKMIGRGYTHAGIPLDQLYRAHVRMKSRIERLQRRERDGVADDDDRERPKKDERTR